MQLWFGHFLSASTQNRYHHLHTQPRHVLCLPAVWLAQLWPHKPLSNRNCHHGS